MRQQTEHRRDAITHLNLSKRSGCQIRDQLMRVFKNQQEGLPYNQPGATPLGVTSGPALAEEEARNHYQGLLQREEKNPPRDGLTCTKHTLLSPQHCWQGCPQPPKAAAPLIPHIPALDTFPVRSLCFIACGSLCLSQHRACCPLSLGMLAVPPAPYWALLLFHRPGGWKWEWSTKPPSRECTCSPRA